MPFSFKEAAKSALRYAKAFANIPNVITATNYLKTFSKSDYSYSADAMKPFSGRERAKLTEQFAESLGLGPGGKLPAAEGFNKYTTSRISNIGKFTTVKVGEDTLAKKLEPTSKTPDDVKTAMTSVKKAVNGTLKLTEATKGAKSTFETDMADLKECLLNPEFNYLPKSLTDYLFHIKGGAAAAIRAQHDEENEKLETLFEDDEFLANLQTSLGFDALDGDELKEQLDAVKKDMLAELKASQAKELSAFEAELDKPIKAMLSTSKERVAFLAMIDKNEQNKEAINKLIAATTGDLAARTGSKARSESSRYKNVDIKGLKTIMTATGRKIDATGENTYTLALPNRILSPHYYRSSQHNLKRDIMMLPLALKARGFDTIEMNINHPNKEYAKKLARVAMEACIEAGFKPEDIKIRVGEDLYSEEKPGDIKRKLFSDCGSRYDLALAEAKKNEKEWNEAIEETEADKTPEEFQKHVKESLAGLKKAGEAIKLAGLEEGAAERPDVPVPGGRPVDPV